MATQVTLISGDGIGPSITNATVRLLAALSWFLRTAWQRPRPVVYPPHFLRDFIRHSAWFHRGLPGNPAAALVTALVVARPFLLRAQGVAEVGVRPLRLPAAFDWRRANGRRQYLRARIASASDGSSQVLIHPRQGSAMLLAASWAEGLAVVEAGRTLAAGEAVDFLPFAELLH